ncbi:MAG: hypothetical protein PHQ75_00025 [Thermoguttaceae bacterium]|nr:hypothetical protein [Thermoguttaceae bacterium]
MSGFKNTFTRAKIVLAMPRTQVRIDQRLELPRFFRRLVMVRENRPLPNLNRNLIAFRIDTFRTKE